MKKRLIPLVLALLLVNSVAFATQYTPLDEKLQLQARNGSGLTGTIMFEASSGAQMSALDSATNAILGTLLPGSTLDMRYLRALFGINKGREELRLTLKRDDQDAGTFTYVADDAVATLASSLIGTTVLAFGKGDTTLGGLLAEADAAWPGLEPLLLVLNSADNDWRKLADAALDRYTAKVSVWMQSFTKVSTEDIQGAKVTRTTVIIPAAAVKAQVKQLLMDLYQNNDVVALLQQRMSAYQAAAYLDKNMMNAFFTALDSLLLSRDVTLERVFDATGAISQSSMVLPLGGFRDIDVMETSYQAVDPQTGSTTIKLHFLARAGQPAPVWTLAYTGGSEAATPDTQAYKGSLSMNTNPRFTVGEGEDEANTQLVYGFNLNMTQTEETYQQTDRGMAGRKAYQITLLVTPETDANTGAQSFQLNAALSGLSNDRAATAFSGTLVWEDLKTEGSYTATFDGTTAAPWNIGAPDITNATWPKDLAGAQRDALRQQLSLALQQAIAGLAARFLVPSP